MKNEIPDSDCLREGFPPTLTQAQFTKLALTGKIVDARAGGLLWGRTYEEGGILALFKMGTSYVVRGRAEAGEFVVNWKAATQNFNRLKAMNAGLAQPETVDETDQIPVPQCINTSADPDDRLIYLHWGQVVISKDMTVKHFKELSALNQRPNPYLTCDLRRIFKLDRSTDGVV